MGDEVKFSISRVAVDSVIVRGKVAIPMVAENLHRHKPREVPKINPVFQMSQVVGVLRTLGRLGKTHQQPTLGTFGVAVEIEVFPIGNISWSLVKVAFRVLKPTGKKILGRGFHLHVQSKRVAVYRNRRMADAWRGQAGLAEQRVAEPLADVS